MSTKKRKMEENTTLDRIKSKRVDFKKYRDKLTKIMNPKGTQTFWFRDEICSDHILVFNTDELKPVNRDKLLKKIKEWYYRLAAKEFERVESKSHDRQAFEVLRKVRTAYRVGRLSEEEQLQVMEALNEVGETVYEEGPVQVTEFRILRDAEVEDEGINQNYHFVPLTLDMSDVYWITRPYPGLHVLTPHERFGIYGPPYGY